MQKIKCNLCNHIQDEADIIEKNDVEYCASCKRTGALMDVELELIKGLCESCGHEYALEAILADPVHCAKCGKETENFDTVDGSLMAPSIIKIDMNK